LRGRDTGGGGARRRRAKGRYFAETEVARDTAQHSRDTASVISATGTPQAQATLSDDGLEGIARMSRSETLTDSAICFGLNSAEPGAGRARICPPESHYSHPKITVSQVLFPRRTRFYTASLFASAYFATSVRRHLIMILNSVRIEGHGARIELGTQVHVSVVE